VKLLVVTGGQHPYAESTPVLESFLVEAGHQVDVTEETKILASSELSEYDVLVFNTLRRNETTLAEGERTGMTQFIGGGGAFVCIHISGAPADAWPEYHDVTGGGWIFGQSTHPPYGQFRVTMSDPDHPCADGIEDFVTNDELYTKLGWREGNHVFLTADLDGVPQPMAWTRSYGNGRVFATALGHNGLSFQTPQFQRLVLNGVDWAGG
jgi:type 1 glutamine amidotransferase